MTDIDDLSSEENDDQQSSNGSPRGNLRRTRPEYREEFWVTGSGTANDEGKIEFESVKYELVDDPSEGDYLENYEEVKREIDTCEPLTSPFDVTSYPDDIGPTNFDKLFNKDSGPHVPEFEWTVDEETGVIIFDTNDVVPDGYFDIPVVEFSLYVKPDLSNVIRRELKNGKSLEEAVGKVREYDTLFPTHPDIKLTHSPDVSNEGTVRLYTYWQLTDNAAHTVTDRADQPSFRDQLSISESISRNTLAYTISDRIDELGPPNIDVSTREVIREFRDADLASQLRELPDVETDGTAPPQDTLFTRQVKKTGYSCIQLGRTGNWTKYDKWEIFKPYELAAKDDVHVNGAAKNLDGVNRYWPTERDSPDDKTLWNQLRGCSRSQLQRMFLAAYDQFIDLALRNEHIPEKVEVAIDITGWPWYSIENNPLGTQPEKPSRNYDKSWQFATLSLVNVDLPFTIGVREIASRKNKQYNIQQLLDLVESKFNVERVYVDRGFYSRAIRDEFVSRDLNFVMMARRNMGLFNDLVDGVAWEGKKINHAPYQISTDDEDDYEDWLIARFSEKRSNLRKKNTSNGLAAPYCDWEAYYTNIDPDEYDGGPEQLTDDYRLRWGIETSYRLLKNNFLMKASTDLWEKRMFLFCLSVLYYNMWLGANSLKASARDEPVKDDQGRYQMAAHRFMMLLFSDFETVPIGEVEDLSKKREMVQAAFEDTRR